VGKYSELDNLQSNYGNCHPDNESLHDSDTELGSHTTAQHSHNCRQDNELDNYEGTMYWSDNWWSYCQSNCHQGKGMDAELGTDEVDDIPIDQPHTPHLDTRLE
jgi:hypothetical protein